MHVSEGKVLDACHMLMQLHPARAAGQAPEVLLGHEAEAEVGDVQVDCGAALLSIDVSLMAKFHAPPGCQAVKASL